MIIQMPVEVFHENCKNCPDLDVDVITRANHIVTSVDESGDIHQKDEYTNILRCKNCDRCGIIFKAVLGTSEIKPVVDISTKAKTKTAKKPAAKATKTAAKKGTKNG